ncbi:MAG: hypothetical protein JWM80_3360 [Cyanobacteria bacterium RYN_339]|nr:hypothetical protein [Cyanobacteria bacterium RYN_339]
MVRRLLAAALILMPLNGCAVISGFFGVGKDEVSVIVQGTHEPVEVEVQGLYNGLKNTFHGKDKVMVRLTKDQDYKLIIRSPGFETQEVVMQKKFNTFALLDGLCCVGGVISGGIQGAKIVPAGAAASALAPLGAAAGICCSGGVGCCATGILYTIDSVAGSTQVHDTTVTIKLKPARQTDRGWILPVDVDGITVDVPVHPRTGS